MIKSTIVIPNYNGMKYIEACLDSLYTGTCKEFHVIVVDNASTDGSMELIREKYPQVELIVNDENTGFCKAVNQGIRASRTPYVILLNNDTRAGLSFIHELERAIESDRRYFSAGAKMLSLYDKDTIDDAGDYYCALGWAFARGKGCAASWYTTDCEIFAACGGAAIYRREYLDEVGLFDENHFAYLEDVDIGYRALLAGYRSLFAANALVYHAGSATTGSRYNEFKTRLAARNSVYLIYKNMPVGQIVLNSPFLLIGFLVKTLFFVKKGLGSAYVSGLGQGIRLASGQEGRTHKVHFCTKNLRSYVYVQLRLWCNLLYLFKN